MNRSRIIYKAYIPKATAFQPTKLELSSDIINEMLSDGYRKTDYKEVQTSEEQPVENELEQARSLLGKHQYKTDNIDVGNMQEFLDLASKEGVSLRITSGLREGATTSNGNQSNHATGNAIDVTPIEGQTWDDLLLSIRTSPKLRAYMKDKGMRILDERGEDMLTKTGGTAPHLHFSFGKTEGKSSDEFFA